jgi:hypothetical protein
VQCSSSIKGFAVAMLLYLVFAYSVCYAVCFSLLAQPDCVVMINTVTVTSMPCILM